MSERPADAAHAPGVTDQKAVQETQREFDTRDAENLAALYACEFCR